jgi:hypothetical protein
VEPVELVRSAPPPVLALLLTQYPVSDWKPMS